MTEKQLFILNEVYFKTGNGNFITIGELETVTGLSGSELRPILEDLKQEGLVVEHQEGFQLSRHGLTISKTKWD